MRILCLRWRTSPAPDGCRWCGTPMREHARQWVPSRHWHSWCAPTFDQRKARIVARVRKNLGAS